MVDDTLFDDPDLDRPDPAERRGIRRLVLSGVLQQLRGRHDWSVNDAASAASIAPMTWRRLEDGLDVRRRSLAAVDSLLDRPFGTTARALDDDMEMLALLTAVGEQTRQIHSGNVADFLEHLAERARSGTAPAIHIRPATVYANAGTATARASLGGVTATTGSTVMPADGPSTLSLAAQLVVKLVDGPQTEAVEHAIASVLAAMGDMVTPRIDDATDAVDVLATSGNVTLEQAAGEVAKLATEAAIAAHRQRAADEDNS